MIRGFYSAASSLVSQQVHLSAIANNIANSNTVGYKPQQAGFSSLLYKNLNGGAGNPISIGHGTKLNKLGIDFSQGNLKKTDMKYDCAILGSGFFAVKNKENDAITYTRDGSFKMGLDGNNSYLVNSSGDFVLDSSGNKIELNEGFDSSKIGVFTFKNPYALKLLGNNQFIDTESSGKAEILSESKINVGYLESSAVQIAQEMVNMIEASKAFSFGSKVIQATDEMEKTANQLR